MISNKTKKKLQELSEKYETVMQLMEKNAERSIEKEGRAYGGVIRSVKGKLQEDIAENIIDIAWTSELKQSRERIDINSRKIEIPICMEYVKKINSKRIKKEILSTINNYKYKLSVDKHVFIDSKFIIGVECKAYTENAMLKRILVDFMLLKTKFNKLKTYLFQLESMLGGDYNKASINSIGSSSSHSIMSYFDTVNLNILTLLEGERKVNRPINRLEFFKPLKISALEYGVSMIVEDLKDY